MAGRPPLRQGDGRFVPRYRRRTLRNRPQGRLEKKEGPMSPYRSAGAGRPRGAHPRSRRVSVSAMAVMVLVGTLGGVSAGAEPPEPASLRLFAGADRITARTGPSGWAYVELAAWVTPVGGDFELWAHRPSYRDPVVLRQVDPESRAVLRELPADLLAGWRGLRRFLRVTVLDAAGERVSRRALRFCPGTWRKERVSDEGPARPTYPGVCWGMPLTRGLVWGIEEHWAVNPLGDRGVSLRPGRYTARTEILPPYRDLFGIADEDAVVETSVVVRRGGAGPMAATEEEDDRGSSAPSGPVPEVTDPDPSTLPDLQVLPAWGIGTQRRSGRDFVTFGSTAWNEGPGPLVVEGFRSSGEPDMEAFQYFYQGGEPVGRAPAGHLEYDPRPGHRHWHFTQFVRYTLLDASRTQAVRSRKESFCLVPTDAVDLTVEGAEWSAFDSSLWSSCGSASSIWIREILQAGWGDTYFQTRPGQAFNITDLPNGRYFIRMEVNPDGLLHDGDATNDTSMRRIRLAGRPGSRRVVVPPWNGIDTEGGCWECFESARAEVAADGGALGRGGT